MAKVSARGCTEVASLTTERTGKDGVRRRTRLVLRSDGAILRADSHWSQYGDDGYWYGGNLYIWAVPDASDVQHRVTLMRERAEKYANDQQLGKIVVRRGC